MVGKISGDDDDSVADDDWDDTPSSRVAFTGGGRSSD